MQVDRETLRKNFASTPDEELLERHSRGELTDLALEVIEDELRSRGLQVPVRPKPELVSELRPRSPRAFWKKVLAQLVGIVVGIIVWLFIGAAGLWLAISQNDDSLRTIAAWVGMFVGASVWGLVSNGLKKRWRVENQEEAATSQTED